MKLKTFIYGLKVSGTNDIRYVGKANDLYHRLRKHLWESKFKKTHKDCWIFSTLKSGKKIECVIIEEVEMEKWPEREIYWINYYSTKFKLVNHCKGGRGGRPIKYNLSYEKFKSWVNKNLPFIKSMSQWIDYCKNNKLPSKISPTPSSTYRNRGWIRWGELFNTNSFSYSNINHWKYDVCKKYIKKLNIINTNEWKRIKNSLPIEIPRCPDKYFSSKGQWLGWRDFLQTNGVRKNSKTYYSYIKAKEYIFKTYGATLSVKKWKNKEFLKKLSIHIPTKPDRHYAKTGEWEGWGKFLQTNSKKPGSIKWQNYEEAKKFVISLKLKNNKEWREYSKSSNRQADIPTSPEKVYNEWTCWEDWLGKEFYYTKSKKRHLLHKN